MAPCGSLNNSDGDGNENGKNAIRLDLQDNNFARVSHFLYILCMSLHQSCPCDLRTVKHTLQNVYPCCRSVRSGWIDTWLIRTVTVRVYWTTLHCTTTIVNVPNFTFSPLRTWSGTQDNDFILSSSISIQPSGIQLQKNLPTFYNLNEME